MNPRLSIATAVNTSKSQGAIANARPQLHVGNANTGRESSREPTRARANSTYTQHTGTDTLSDVRSVACLAHVQPTS